MIAMSLISTYDEYRRDCIAGAVTKDDDEALGSAEC